MKSTEKIEKAVLTILREIGEDPTRPGLLDTPKRVANSFYELTSGYSMDPDQVINDAIFRSDYDEMVLVRNIEFASLCEHHLLPFVGLAHIAYIPDGWILGLSKMPRIVDMFSKRLQVQERMTVEIANFIDKRLKPKGVAVVIEALHTCSMIRGVKKNRARMVTSAMRGVFKENTRTRMEFLSLISREAGREV